MRKPLNSPKPKTVTFEKALKALREGAPALRRVAWHPKSKIVRIDGDVFVMNKPYFGPAPRKWEPYSDDFLAKDWVVLS